MCMLDRYEKREREGRDHGCVAVLQKSLLLRRWFLQEFVVGRLFASMMTKGPCIYTREDLGTPTRVRVYPVNYMHVDVHAT